MAPDAKLMMVFVNKYTDPKLWRNVPQCVVDCC